MNRFTQTMRNLRSSQTLGLFPYLTAGFPDGDRWTDILDVMVDCGADGLEVGMPYSIRWRMGSQCRAPEPRRWTAG